MADIRTQSPSREEIERRAYEIYEARGREDGRAVEDWIAAENELAQQASNSRSSNTITMAKPKSAAAGRDRI